jgi:hypothetical protein
MSMLAPSIDVQVKSVLIATDFSPASERALCQATAVARLYEAKFYLLHVVLLHSCRSRGNECCHGGSLDRCPTTASVRGNTCLPVGRSESVTCSR